jgi:hypothetical protein
MKKKKVNTDFSIKLSSYECPYRRWDENTPAGFSWCGCQDGNPLCCEENCKAAYEAGVKKGEAR